MKRFKNKINMSIVFAKNTAWILKSKDMNLFDKIKWFPKWLIAVAKYDNKKDPLQNEVLLKQMFGFRDGDNWDGDNS